LQKQQKPLKFLKNIEIPARRRSSKAGKYPFAQMQVGQSFHIAATEENPEPGKRMQSTCSTATRRYKVANSEGVLQVTRKFVVRTVDETDPKGPGARIFREI